MRTIKTDTHLLLVDETAEIKEGELRVAYSLHGDVPFISEASDIAEKRKRKNKIVAASPKLNDLPEFETLPPNTEDDVEKLFEKYFLELNKKNKYEDNYKNRDKSKRDYKAGYQQAKSETMFSLEDMDYAINRAYANGVNKLAMFKDGIIQSLTEPKEYEFVPEMEEYGTIAKDFKDVNYRPKIINGKIQGTWKLK